MKKGMKKQRREEERKAVQEKEVRGALKKWKKEKAKKFGLVNGDKKAGTSFDQHLRRDARDYLALCKGYPVECEGMLKDSVDLALDVHGDVAWAAVQCHFVGALPAEPVYQTILDHITRLCSYLASLRGRHFTSEQVRIFRFALSKLQKISLVAMDDENGSAEERMRVYERLWKQTEHVHHNSNMYECLDSEQALSKDVQYVMRDFGQMSSHQVSSMQRLLPGLDAASHGGPSGVPEILCEVKDFYSRSLSEIAAFAQNVLSDKRRDIGVQDYVYMYRFMSYVGLAFNSLNYSILLESPLSDLILQKMQCEEVGETSSDQYNCIVQILSNRLPKDPSTNSNSKIKCNGEEEDEKRGSCVSFSLLIDAMEEAVPHMVRILKQHPHSLTLAKITIGTESLLNMKDLTIHAGETDARSYHKWMIVYEHMCQVLGQCSLCHKGTQPNSTTTTNNNNNNNNNTPGVGVKACSACHIAVYCSTECQCGDWPRHKLVCKLHASFSY